MKYIFLFILVSYASLSGFTQEISGTISNMQNRQLVFVTNDTYLKARYDTVYPDEQGNFKIALNLSQPGYAVLWNINFEGRDLYVIPGHKLRIEADGTDNTSFLSTRKYSGDDADINNFIAKTTHPDVYKSYPMSIDMYKYDQERFVSYIKSFYAHRDSIKNAWRSGLSKTRLSAIRDFLLTDSINSAYDMTGYWFSYSGFLKKENREEFYNQIIKPYADQNEDPRFLTSPDYRWFWNRYVRYKSVYPPTGPGWINYWIHLPEVLENNLHGKIKQVVSGSLEESLVSQFLTIADSLVPYLNKTSEYLLKNIADPAVVSEFQDLMDKAVVYRKLVRRGQPAPDFALMDSLGNTYTLADFKGKVIYLDVWASWCGPCIAQFPAAKKLYEKYKAEDDLVFLTISVDNKRADWDKGLKLHQPGGLQLWAEGGYANSFTKSYGANGIPHYVVIDKEGKIVNFKSPRPEDEPAISNLLNETIAQ